MTPPNLFKYATKELSQGAFICWLSAWADKTYEPHHPLLHQTARLFIDSLFNGTEKKLPQYDTIIVSREVSTDSSKKAKKIDILLELVAKEHKVYCILIENKIDAKDNNDFKRYREYVLKSYKEDQVLCCILRTGFHGRRTSIEHFNYYKKEDLYKVLEHGKNIDNNIFQDFYLKQTEELGAVKRFKTKPFDKWDFNDWQGLFIYLYNSEDFKDSNWDIKRSKTPNFWYNNVAIRGMKLHIAISPKKLVEFRIWSKSLNINEADRQNIFDILEQKVNLYNIQLKKSTIKLGKSTARIAEYPDFSNIFRLDNGILDLEHLKDRLLFLGEIVNECNS